MDAVKELIASMKDSFRERLSDPLLGAFIFAWLAWNARLLMVVFGEGAWADKLEYLDKKPYLDWWAWSTHAGLFPLLSAVAFVLVFPFVNRWVLVFSRQQQRLTYEKILKIDEEVPLTRADAARLRQRMKLAQIEMAKEIEALRETNEDVSEALRVTKEDLEKLRAQQAALSTVSSTSGSEGSTHPRVSGEEEEEDEPPRVSNDDPTDTLAILGRVDRVQLKEEDFFGLPQSTVMRLVQRGVTGQQLQMLFVCRDSGQVVKRLMEDVLAMKGFEFKALLDEVIALKLLEPGLGGQYQITSAGRQALKAALRELKLAAVPYQKR